MFLPAGEINEARNKAHVFEKLYLTDTHQGKLDFLQKLQTPSW